MPDCTPNYFKSHGKKYILHCIGGGFPAVYLLTAMDEDTQHLWLQPSIKSAENTPLYK